MPRFTPLSPLFALLLFLFASGVGAEESAGEVAGGMAGEPAGVPLLRVDALRSPAWIVRDKVRTPLKPGTVLVWGDSLYTGQQGGIQLALFDGGRVRIGERAFAFVGQLKPPEGDSPLLRIDMFRGTFDYQHGREAPKVQFDGVGFAATLTAGSIWGRVQSSRDELALLGGKASLQYGEAPPVELRKRGEYFEVEGSEPALLHRLKEEELVRRSADLALEGGVQRAEGEWQAILISFKGVQRAAKLEEKFLQGGYPIERLQVEVKGEPWWRIVVPGFATQEEAQAFADAVAGRFEIDKPWVSK